MYALKQKKEAPNQRCKCCGYEWCTASKLRFVSCPSCRRPGLRIPIENKNKGKSVQPSKFGDLEAAQTETPSTHGGADTG
jgi:hypothetical protein